MSVSIYLTDRLKDILERHDIEPEDYKPAYGGESVGLDLYYAGDFPIKFEAAKTNGTLMSPEPEEIKLIPTGLHIALQPNYAGLILDRGSISKTPLMRRAGVVDPSYTGQVFVNLISPTTAEYWLYPGDKLPVQLVVVPCVTDFRPVTLSEYTELTSTSKRKDGKTGSSD